MQKQRALQGFSLVELSIVLVILGLLVGGILGGQSLIHAAELRSISKDYEKYHTAIYTFRDKYFALPGDFNKAEDFWGSATSCPGDHTTPATDSRTCDGNGDGTLDSPEGYRFWQHLSNAGLIEGQYTGVYGGATAPEYQKVGVNLPASKISRAGYRIAYLGTQPPTQNYEYPDDYGHVIMFGIPAGGGGTMRENTLRAEDAWNIDVKMDDGRPGLGKLMVYKPVFHTDCVQDDETDANLAEYDLANTNIGCAFILKTGF